MTDMRYYEIFYGIHVDDWSIEFSDAFTSHHHILTKEYINEGSNCSDYSTATGGAIDERFIYPHHITKTYFVEGVIEGHITLASHDAEGTVYSYQVSLCKVHETTGAETELFTTESVTINEVLSVQEVSGTTIGEERVYPFWIDAWEKAELSEYERFYVRIEVTCSDSIVLWHSNDSTWEDIKIKIPLLM